MTSETDNRERIVYLELKQQQIEQRLAKLETADNDEDNS